MTETTIVNQQSFSLSGASGFVSIDVENIEDVSLTRVLLPQIGSQLHNIRALKLYDFGTDTFFQQQHAASTRDGDVISIRLRIDDTDSPLPVSTIFPDDGSTAIFSFVVNYLPNRPGYGNYFMNNSRGYNGVELQLQINNLTNGRVPTIAIQVWNTSRNIPSSLPFRLIIDISSSYSANNATEPDQVYTSDQNGFGQWSARVPIKAYTGSTSSIGDNDVLAYDSATQRIKWKAITASGLLPVSGANEILITDNSNIQRFSSTIPSLSALNVGSPVADSVIKYNGTSVSWGALTSLYTSIANQVMITDSSNIQKYSSTLPSLQVLNINNPSNGQVLGYNGTNIVWTSISQVPASTANQILTSNTSNVQAWRSTVPTLDVLNVGSPTTGQVLRYNGTSVAWGSGLPTSSPGTILTTSNLGEVAFTAKLPSLQALLLGPTPDGVFLGVSGNGIVQWADPFPISTANQLLVTNASNVRAFSSTIPSLQTLNVGTPTSGQVISYNGTNVVWTTLPSGLPTTGNNQILTTNGSGVASFTTTIPSLAALNVGGPTTGQVLQYNGTNVVWSSNSVDKTTLFAPVKIFNPGNTVMTVEDVFAQLESNSQLEVMPNYTNSGTPWAFNRYRMATGGSLSYTVPSSKVNFTLGGWRKGGSAQNVVFGDSTQTGSVLNLGDGTNVRKQYYRDITFDIQVNAQAFSSCVFENCQFTVGLTIKGADAPYTFGGGNSSWFSFVSCQFDCQVTIDGVTLRDKISGATPYGTTVYFDRCDFTNKIQISNGIPAGQLLCGLVFNQCVGLRGTPSTFISSFNSVIMSGLCGFYDTTAYAATGGVWNRQFQLEGEVYNSFAPSTISRINPRNLNWAITSSQNVNVDSYWSSPLYFMGTYPSTAATNYNRILLNKSQADTHYPGLSTNNTMTGTNTFSALTTHNGGLSMGSQKITNLANPTLGTDAVNLSYLQGNFAGLGTNNTFTGTNTFSALTTHNGGLSMGSQKITNLANPTTGSDAVNLTYLQANYQAGTDFARKGASNTFTFPNTFQGVTTHLNTVQVNADIYVSDGWVKLYSEPVVGVDATSKTYVDNNIAGIQSSTTGTGAWPTLMLGTAITTQPTYIAQKVGNIVTVSSGGFQMTTGGAGQTNIYTSTHALPVGFRPSLTYNIAPVYTFGAFGTVTLVASVISDGRFQMQFSASNFQNNTTYNFSPWSGSYKVA